MDHLLKQVEYHLNELDQIASGQNHNENKFCELIYVQLKFQLLILKK